MTRSFFTDDSHWLERAERPQQTDAHVCGRCRTPWGRSALPCPNDPAVQELRRAELRRRIADEFGTPEED